MHTIVMTGATSGIGRVAASELLRRDPELHLVLLAREKTGAATVEELKEISQHVSLVAADLGDLGQLREAAATVKGRLDAGSLPPLRGLAGNAGVSLDSATRTTPAGYETTFAVNVLANHVLIAELASAFESDGRVVVTVSDTHFGGIRYGMPSPRWSDPEALARPGAFERPQSATAGRTAYTTSKLAGIYLAHEWARRLPSGVDIVAYNPGLVPGTGLSRDGGAVAQLVMRRLTRVLTVTPLADSVADAGRKLADAISGRTPAASGDYVDRTRPARSSDESYDTEREQALWNFGEVVRERIGA